MDKFYKNNRRINNHVGKSEKRKGNETNENVLLFTMNLPLDFDSTKQKFDEIFHIKHNKIQKTRKHSSRRRTIQFSSPGGICPLPLKADPSGCRPPKDRPEFCGQTTPPGGRLPPLPHAEAGHVNCDVCWETIPLVDRMTDTCKSITLPQTSFPGGNNEFRFSLMNCRESYLIIEKMCST